jgi:hypothetical protein
MEVLGQIHLLNMNIVHNNAGTAGTQTAALAFNGYNPTDSYLTRNRIL